MDVTIGELVDKKYRIVRLLGEGGMGAVYEGENIRVHNRVAIKVLHAGIATNQAAVDRFEREAQAAGRIGSEHIVEVYDLGDLPSGARYMVMEYLDGESLSARVTAAGRLTAVAVGTVMMQLLEGLAAAHKASIIHRDLKPDNIFLMKAKGGGDFVKIVDFGVSKFNALSGDSKMSMTRTGAVIGTPYYMSPEQARGAKDSDHRSDLYSAGVVMFECVTGQVPFLADTFNELMFKIVLEPPPDPEKMVPGLDPDFAAIIKKGMAREPANRYQTAEEFGQAITQWMATMGPISSLATTPRNASGSLPEIPGAAPSSPNLAVHAQTANPNRQLGGTPNPNTQHLGGTANALASSAHNAPAAKSNIGVAMGAAALMLLIVGGVAAMAMRNRADAPSASPASAIAATETKLAETKPPPTEPPSTVNTSITPLAAVPAAADAGAAGVAANVPAVDASRTRSGRSSTVRTTQSAETPKPSTPKTETKPAGRIITEQL